MMNFKSQALNKMHLRTSMKGSLNYSFRPQKFKKDKSARKICRSKSRSEIGKYGVGCFKS